MTLSELNALIEQMAPSALCASLDNSGLQVGDLAQEITRILLCVDCTEAVVDEAIAGGFDCILSHHPWIFPSVSQLCEQQPHQRVLRKLIRHGIALIAAHTNLDAAPGGVCETLGQAMGLLDMQPVQAEDGGDFGRIGAIAPCTLRELAQRAKRVLDATCVRVAGDLDARIARLCVASGSGTSCMEDALQKGAQCIVTGDVRYHTALSYAARGLCIIDAGHYDTEKIVLPVWQSRLQTRFHALQYSVDLCVASSGADVFVQIG